MKFRVAANLVGNYKTFARRAGYAFIFDRRSGQESFVKRLGSSHYPRLHLYISSIEDDLIFDLHLDQKKASYQGYHRHNAEYDHELVREEIIRLKSLLGVDSINSNDLLNDFSESRDQAVFSGNLDEDLVRLRGKKKKRFLFF
jgi:hypothetical protein